ncbi:response regulator [Undibacterium oligocarboniphilum]|uniref:Response regulator transcription factor n=1 Tax=Undibacterium oligocarboniphilum TaxID=666702 RepID=A0A850QRG0_9BURK|nr:response regulator transcription factor [Undibacterium oligocarboniphilum]MBC3871460.1 response regulator transcription factor [Undibacterium oligocarboniphilum]NVO78964.1 response regulator transcription factor [Undibacterium oligocarboniphilum]
MESHLKPVTVLLADDQQLLLETYARVLTEFGMQIVGYCKTPEEAVLKYKELRPNVLLLDIRFRQEKSGFDALKEIMEFDPYANILVISQHDEAPFIKRAYQYGAKSFLDKNCEAETLATAVKAVSLGQKYHVPGVTAKVMDLLTNQDPDPFALLSEIDMKIFKLLAAGKTNQEISKELGLKIGFVSTHRRSIEEKLHIDRPQQISILAMRYGLLQI